MSIREVEPLIECLVDYVAENPGASRSDVAKACGVSYWRARYWLDRLVKGGFYYKGEFQHEGWLNKKVEVPRPRTRRITYYIRRHRLMNVWSFNYKIYPDQPITRHVEVIAQVDKPTFIYLSPNYIIRVLLEYSAWMFTVENSLRAKRFAEEVWGATLDKWMPKKYVAKKRGISEEDVEKFLKSAWKILKKRRETKLKEAMYVPGLWVAGEVEEEPSGFKNGEIQVYIEYTDYDYPDNSFDAEKIFNIHDWKSDKLKEKVVGWIIEVCYREFGWGTVGKPFTRVGWE